MRVFRCLLLATIVAAAPALAQTPGADDAALRGAFDAADRGELAPADLARYREHPLADWLRVSAIRGRLDVVDADEVQTLLRHLGNAPAGRWLRDTWLPELARRKDWRHFRLDYRGSESAALRCADLSARLAGRPADQHWRVDAREIWLTGHSLPEACDAPMATLAADGYLGEGLRWQRIELALGEGETALARYLARGLPARDQALARAYADYTEAPADVVPADWPKTARTRAVVASALSRLARRNPDGAAARLPAAADALAFTAEQAAAVRYQIALWAAASLLPNAAQRLAEVPDATYDERLYEWRAREAIARGDDAAALAAIVAMPAAQRTQPRWTYFEARLRERAGQTERARQLYATVAASPTFHGWLAADRLDQPYALCPLDLPSAPAWQARVDADAGLNRAIALFRLDRPGPAAREWSSAIATLDDDQRRYAVQRAIDAGWYDRAVFGLGSSPDDTRYYALRFPLEHAQDIRAQSRANGLDPAWVAGEIRAESAFMPDARSGADARGLMQLLPGTGEMTARRLGLSWTGGNSLYDPDTNLVLGTAYLRQVLDRFDGQAYLAIAAYNAGPAPVQRWREARPALEPDFFIEAMPYKETREYVARVLAFSVVYDWRLNGRAAPLSDRLLGKVVDDPAQRRAFTCPTSTAKGT